jgi:hypothetical protein
VTTRYLAGLLASTEHVTAGSVGARGDRELVEPLDEPEDALREVTARLARAAEH